MGRGGEAYIRRWSPTYTEIGCTIKLNFSTSTLERKSRTLTKDEFMELLMSRYIILWGGRHSNLIIVCWKDARQISVLLRFFLYFLILVFVLELGGLSIFGKVCNTFRNILHKKDTEGWWSKLKKILLLNFPLNVNP